MNFKPIQFISEPIEAHFERPPLLEKIPGAPDGFTWRDVYFRIDEILGEWHETRRRGRMARNMQPQHAARAARKGSWGVGQDYYRVRTSSGQIFELYYDRAPVDIDRRKGAWYLYRELALST